MSFPKRNFFNRTVLAAALVVSAISGSAYAQSGPCHEDMQKFCGQIEKGDGRIVKCMQEHKDQLSTACKEHHEKMKSEFKSVKQACHDDVAKFCHDVKPGAGRIMRCMKEHKSEFSASCQKEIDAHKSKKEK